MIVAYIVFPVVFLTVLLCVGLALAFHESKRKNRVRQLLRTSEPEAQARPAELVRDSESADALASWLKQLPPIRKLDQLVTQSLIGWDLSRAFFTIGIAGIVGAIVGWQLALFSSRPLSAASLFAVAAYLPVLWMMRARSKARKAFEEQFPEALDFLSRSMRAGHAFSISLETLASDTAEPMATVLRRVCHEIHMGAPLHQALEKMLIQFPLVDVRFFVSSVLLQQETGGNLSEILGKLSTVVRERFRLRGQVKAMSAHGRITGLVLLLMPVFVVLTLMVISPAYLQGMFNDNDGRLMIYGVVAGQIVGYFCIKKIVNIKV